jgi:hypothetical protein
MAGQVDILGDGLAACCSAYLLSRQGNEPRVQRSSRPRPARLLLNEQTQSLLRETFHSSDLFQHAPRIHTRIVSWGQEAQPLELPHRGVVVSEEELLTDLWRQAIPDPASSSAGNTNAAWTIASIQNTDSLPKSWQFGSRLAATAMVELTPQAADHCCWIESLPGGWLFLLPSGNRRGALVSVGYSPGDLIEQSRLITRQISNLTAVTSPAHYFPAFPQILSELSGPNWLACGSAAMTFDPLCGEGAGHAVREALLAAAVVHASEKGYATETLLNHYATRLMMGFLRHLHTCLPFYLTGGVGDFWKAEAAALQAGITWMQDRLRAGKAPLYRLVEYELQPIAGDPGALYARTPD